MLVMIFFFTDILYDALCEYFMCQLTRKDSGWCQSVFSNYKINEYIKTQYMVVIIKS